LASRPLPTTNGAFVPVGMQEPILRRDSREIGLLVADENLSLTYASRAAGERVTRTASVGNADGEIASTTQAPARSTGAISQRVLVGLNINISLRRDFGRGHRPLRQR
jgi:hypothetical protein